MRTHGPPPEAVLIRMAPQPSATANATPAKMTALAFGRPHAAAAKSTRAAAVAIHAPREHGPEPREAALSSEDGQERAYGERVEPGERRGVEHQIRHSLKAQNDTQEHASGRSRRGEPAKLTA